MGAEPAPHVDSDDKHGDGRRTYGRVVDSADGPCGRANPRDRHAWREVVGHPCAFDANAPRYQYATAGRASVSRSTADPGADASPRMRV